MDKEFWKLYTLLLRNKPKKSDAVIWLQGDRFDRAENVLKSYTSKLAECIVISGNNILIGGDARKGENNISLSEMQGYLLENGVDTEDIIVDDGALNTKDQAVHTANIIKQKKWKSVILVSSAYNQPRALLTFLRQMRNMNVSAIIYNYPAVLGMGEIPGGRMETVKELCTGEINKIREYKNDLFSITFGIKYLSDVKYYL